MPNIIKITFINRLNSLETPQLVAVAKYFNVDITTRDYLNVNDIHNDHSPTIINRILSTCNQLSHNRYNLDKDIKATSLCCFGPDSQMVCTYSSLNSSLHQIILPGYLKCTGQKLPLTFDDKIKLLIQKTKFESSLTYNTATVTLDQLCTTQMRSVLCMTDTAYDRNDDISVLRKRLLKNPTFVRCHMTTKKGNAKIATFSFSKDNPFDCIDISSECAETYKEDDPCTKQTPAPQLIAGTQLSLNQNKDNNLQQETEIKESSENISIVTDSSTGLPESNTDYEDYFSIKIAPKKHQGVIDNICKECKAFNLKDQTLECYLCKLKVHYCCYSPQNSKQKGKSTLCKSTFDKVKPLSNHKWFCNQCSLITIDELLIKISNQMKIKMNTMVQEATQEMKNKMETETNPNTANKSSEEQTHLNTNAPGYRSYISQIKEDLTQEVKETVKEEMRSVKDEITSFFKSLSQPSPNRSYSTSAQINTTEPIITSKKNPQLIIPKTPIHLNQTNARQAENLLAKSVASSRTIKEVNVDLSVIIRNVTNTKIISHDSNLKSEFNKLFNRMKIQHCKKTSYGNIIIELTSSEDVDTVVKNWKPSYFGNPASPQEGTEAVRMKSQSPRNTEGIITNVTTELKDTDINDGLAIEGYTGAKVRRFKKGTVSLTTVKISFETSEDLQKATKNGICIGHIYFPVEIFRYTKRPMQCFKCNKYGHPMKWCRSSRNCGFCSEESHDDIACPHKGDSTKYKCSNCGGDHSARSNRCPHHIEKMSLIKNRNDHDEY